MRIMWVVNRPPEPYLQAAGLRPSPFGGWLEAANDAICQKAEGFLIAFPLDTQKAPSVNLQVQGVSLRSIPIWRAATAPTQDAQQAIEEMIASFRPDVIHIWGTEYVHSHCAVKACQRQNRLHQTLVSIQGLASVCVRHYWGHIQQREYRVFSLRDMLRGQQVEGQARRLKQRGAYEESALRSVQHVGGRTAWDYACTTQINPKLHYHFCPETLRKPFYQGEWKREACQTHLIMTSQASLPLKGFHIAVEALAILRRKWPDAQLCTTGPSCMVRGFPQRLLEHEYPQYLRKLIQKHHLEAHVLFQGTLSAQEMQKAYRRAHVFALPSSIENSPNSLGEAMLLGVPCVAADVGGVKQMMTDEKEGLLYQGDSPAMLAYAIDRIFTEDALASRLSEASRKRALADFDVEKNLATLWNIYHSLACPESGDSTKQKEPNLS